MVLSNIGRFVPHKFDIQSLECGHSRVDVAGFIKQQLKRNFRYLRLNLSSRLLTRPQIRDSLLLPRLSPSNPKYAPIITFSASHEEIFQSLVLHDVWQCLPSCHVAFSLVPLQAPSLLTPF